MKTISQAPITIDVKINIRRLDIVLNKSCLTQGYKNKNKKKFIVLFEENSKTTRDISNIQKLTIL